MLPSCFKSEYSRSSGAAKIRVEPHYSGSQGTNNFFSVIGGILLLPLYEIKENLFMGLKNYFHYWRNYITSGCDCIWNRRAQGTGKHSLAQLARSLRAALPTSLTRSAALIRSLTHSLTHSILSSWERGFCLWLECVDIIAFESTVEPFLSLGQLHASSSISFLVRKGDFFSVDLEWICRNAEWSLNRLVA